MFKNSWMKNATDRRAEQKAKSLAARLSTFSLAVNASILIPAFALGAGHVIFGALCVGLVVLFWTRDEVATSFRKIPTMNAFLIITSTMAWVSSLLLGQKNVVGLFLLAPLAVIYLVWFAYFLNKLTDSVYWGKINE